MRGARWLLLVAIAAIIYVVGVTYQQQIRTNRQNAVKAPPSLPDDVSSTASLGHWTKKDQKSGCTKYELFSKDMRQTADSSHAELTGVELHLFHKSTKQCDAKFDLVKTDAAMYYNSENRLHADSPVDITLGEPTEGEPPSTLVSIHASGGLDYDADTGKADTDKYATFVFKNGEGHATGATYDPPAKLLTMKHDVVVDWKADTPHAEPLHIEAPSLQYQEDKSEIDLVPSGKMTRDQLTFEGGNPIIRMSGDAEGHKFIREIDADHAHGADDTPGKKLTYAADRVWVFYNDDHVIDRIVIEGNADLTSTAENPETHAETSETHVNANHVEMYFNAHGKESQLARVHCTGHAVVTSKPITTAGRDPGDTHVLRSETIDVQMRPGGRDIQTVSAHPSGTLEFLPNVPARHHRTLVGDEMLIAYAPQNRIESFHSTNVKTTTDPNTDEGKRNRAVSTTSSKELSSRFDPKTNELTSMDQSGDFNYQEGDRKVHASRATLDQKQNVMNLEGGARVADATGITTADHIRLDQASNDFLAEGNVNSTRLPDQSQKGDSGMLSGDAPLNARARKMESSNRLNHRVTRYDGGARLWQGANSISAETVVIDRDQHTIVADGHVVTEAWEQPKDDEKKKGAAASLTKVNAPHMVYTDQDRLALYTGGVRLDRGDLHLKSDQLHAWLADSKADSQLEKAFADGAVEVTGARRDNAYKGTSDHAEYYTADQKVVLKGGIPQITRTITGRQPTVIRQAELTYFVNDGKLVGTGAASDRLPPKKK